MNDRAVSFFGLIGDAILQPNLPEGEQSKAAQVQALLDRQKISQIWRAPWQELERMFVEAAHQWAANSEMDYKQAQRRYRYLKRRRFLPLRGTARLIGWRLRVPNLPVTYHVALHKYLDQLEAFQRWLDHTPLSETKLNRRQQQRLLTKCDKLITELGNHLD